MILILCVCLCKERKKRGVHESAVSQVNKKGRTLTLVLALAELLTEILGHHTRAGAVTGMVRVITWLVVVHLIGRVIWSNRRQASDWRNTCVGGHSVVVVVAVR